VIGTV